MSEDASIVAAVSSKDIWHLKELLRHAIFSNPSAVLQGEQKKKIR
jgi:hypothetical protein